MTWTDPATGAQRGGIVKVGYSHKAMADAILANPAIRQGELARIFGVTPGWISQVIASDAFQAYLADRRQEIVDPLLRGEIEESFKGLVLQSVEILREKLNADAGPDLALEVLKTSSKALGYGARVQVDATVNHKHSLVGLLSSIPTPAARPRLATVEGEVLDS